MENRTSVSVEHVTEDVLVPSRKRKVVTIATINGLRFSVDQLVSPRC